MTSAKNFIVSVAIVLSIAAVAKTDLIDFEQFDIGDGVAEINAAYNPLGINFITEGFFRRGHITWWQ